MTTREKVGLVVLTTLLAVLCIVLITVFRKPPGPTHSPAESIFIQQRLINLEKSR